MIKWILFPLLIEGVTELLVNTESLLYKKLHQRNIRKHIPAFVRLVLKCGWCTSLWVAAGLAAAWFFTPLFYILLLIPMWRLANLYHTLNSWLLRVKIFTGGKRL